MANYSAFSFPNTGALDLRAFMSPGDNHNENQNPRTFHSYCRQIGLYTEGLECSICIDPINNSGVLLGCNHSFHQSCIFNCFNHIVSQTNQYARGDLTCPMCRAEAIRTPNFDNGNHQNEYTGPEVPIVPISRNLFGSDDSDDDV